MSEDHKQVQRATRIEQDSVVFKWVVPVLLAVLGLVTILLMIAALAVLLDIFPRG